MSLRVLVLFIIFIKLANSDDHQQCNNSNDTSVECINLNDCPNLKDLYLNPTQDIIKYLNESICKSDSEIYVCCNHSYEITTSEREKNKTNESLYKPKNCGQQTEPNIFPWLVSVSGFGFSFCGGALINSRYLLTSAICASKEFLGEENYVNIIIGDLNLTTRNCSESHSKECVMLEFYGIEDAVPHPLYQISTVSFNDVGLIRLNRSVQFNEYIQPICLPTPETVFAQPGDALYTSEFSVIYDPETGQERIKRNITTTLITYEDCLKRVKTHEVQQLLSPYSMCVELLFYETDYLTFTDNGGPLAYKNNGTWYLAGLLSIYGDKLLTKGTPFIASNISFSLDWIQDNMRPW